MKESDHMDNISSTVKHGDFLVNHKNKNATICDRICLYRMNFYRETELALAGRFVLTYNMNLRKPRYLQ